MSPRAAPLYQPSPTLTTKILQTFGESGRAWLERIPQLLEECAERWDLTIGPPFAGLSYNYVAPGATSEGTPVVLKLGFACPEVTCEIEAMRFYRGDGIARLLDADEHIGAQLLERLTPGSEVLALDDDKAATEIAATLMRRLWRALPEDHPFPSLEQWSMALVNVGAQRSVQWPFSRKQLERAMDLRADLLASAPPPVLLHGDLHHHNILSATREPWLAIDPKGVAGDPAFDAARWFSNPMPWLLRQPDARAITARRVDQFSDLLELDTHRVVAWGFANTVLSGCWALESDPTVNVDDMVACLELFDILA